MSPQACRYVLAVDPGLATGMCLFSMIPGEEPILLGSWEVQMVEFAEQVRAIFAAHEGVEVVCEKFTITLETAKKSQAPYSLEMIGILKLLMLDAGYDPFSLPLQLPTDAKNMFPNPALKKLGYWHRGGEGHALDSIRHGLLYLVKTHWKPTRLLQ